MNTRKIKFAGAFLLGLLMITAINAQPRQGDRGLGTGGAGEGKAHRLEALQLSDKQEEALTALRSDHYKEITPLRNKMIELKARERTLLSEESVDMKAIEKTIDEQTDLMNSMKKLQAKHQLAFRNILTDEQVMKLQQGRQFSQRHGYHGKGMHRGVRGARMERSYRGHRGI